MITRARLLVGTTAFLLALAFALPFLTTAQDRRDYFFFEITLTSSAVGSTQLYWNTGNGFNQTDSSNQPLKIEPHPVVYRYMMSAGKLRGLRFDPIDREGTLTLSHARIVDSQGKVLREFKPEQFIAAQQVGSLEAAGDALRVTIAPQSNDPALLIDLGEPLILAPDFLQLARVVAPVFASVFAAVLALCLLPLPRRLISSGAASWSWLQIRPKTALCLAAFAAVLIQCHPVIFFGRSFVSPNNGIFMLYENFPTVPGSRSPVLENNMGSDVGATLIYHAMLPRLERDALLRDGEWPLWNRMNLTGVPLLGQSQSMFGDPLNWGTILAGGESWAWDLRFVVARWLWALGCGLLVWRLAAHLPAALLTTFTAAFIGYFSFRLNHVASFSVAYSPWILLAWTMLAQASTRRQLLAALLTLLAANWSEMTSGTAKEAYMLMICLNFTGCLLVLLADEPWHRRLRRLAAAAATGVGFVLLSAPVWLSFLRTMQQSYTSYEVSSVQQIPWPYFIGLFDDLFYRQSIPNEGHVSPSLNFAVLFGVLWAAAAVLALRRHRAFLALALGAMLPAALVFKIIPAAWILRVPFLANVQHVENTFSCVLLVLGLTIAGFGVRDFFLARTSPAGWWPRYGAFIVLLVCLVGFYAHHTWHTAYSPFFRGYAAALLLAVAVVPLLFRWGGRRVVAVVLTGALLVTCWRHSQYLTSPFDAYVFNPQERVTLQARSPAISFVEHETSREPDRPAGFGYNLFPGYHQILAWESIYGVDPLRNRHYEALVRAAGLDRVWDWANTVEPAALAPLLPFYDLLGVRHHLATRSSAPVAIPGLRLEAKLDFDIYSSPTVWPRAFFTDRVSSYRSLAEFLEKVRYSDGRPFATVDRNDRGIESLEGLAHDLAQRAVNPATGYRLTTNNTSFEVDATGPGVVVLTEAFYTDDFVALLNGQSVPYFRVNHAFKGIFIPQAGRYQVSFRYWPKFFTLSLWLGAAGLVILAGVGLAVSRGRLVDILPADTGNLAP